MSYEVLYITILHFIKKKHIYIYVPKDKFLAPPLLRTTQNTRVFQQFRWISVCFSGKLISGRYKMNEFFFFFFGYLNIFIFGVLDDHDSPNFSLLDHPSLLLPSFNRPDGSGVLSFLLFSFQRATPNFLYILERQSPILFLKSETSFYFLVKRVNVLGHAPWQSLLFVFLQGIRWIMCIYCTPFDTWCGTCDVTCIKIIFILFVFSVRNK